MTYTLHENGTATGMTVTAPDIDAAYCHVLTHYRTMRPQDRPGHFVIYGEDGSATRGQCVLDNRGAAYISRFG